VVLRYRSLIGGSQHDVEDYISSMEDDRELAKYISMVYLAHLKSLISKGYIPINKDAVKLESELVGLIQSNCEDVYKWVKHENLIYEDFFEALESYLHHKVGAVAGYLALGRSRNDHVAAVLRLYIRDKLIELLVELLKLRKALLERAARYSGIIIPYFTHRQIAQCGDASIYFLSHLHTYTKLWRIIISNLDLLTENPLGAGPAAGTLVDHDFKLLAENLCFNETQIPPYYATGSRLFLLHALSDIVLLLSEISRLAEDMFMLNLYARDAIKPPIEHVATSSIMPHKRNLVTLEVARAKANLILGFLTSAISTYSSLPYGYNLELQELNKVFMETIKTSIDTLRIVGDFIKRLEICPETLDSLVTNITCWSAELVEYVSIESKKPTRQVYFEIGELIKEGRVVNELNIDVKKLALAKPVAVKLKEAMSEYEGFIREDEETLSKLIKNLSECGNKLLKVHS